MQCRSHGLGAEFLNAAQRHAHVLGFQDDANSLGLQFAQWGIFIVGVTTIAQMSFWGNYLPRVYPTHLRGTGESFAANVGGRMIGTFAALVTVQLVNVMPGGVVPIRLAYACAVVGTIAYVINLVASYWLPEPKQADLPD